MNDFLALFATLLFGSMGSLLIFGSYNMIRDRLDNDELVLGGLLGILGLACFLPVVLGVGELLN